MIGFVPRELIPAAQKARKEGRLSWRVTDQHGRPSNGGSAEPIVIGEWSPRIEDPKVCVRGWHTTSGPHRWAGCRVFLVEGEGLEEAEEDKSCWERIRPLGEVDPQKCLSASVFVRCAPCLQGADLRGANLQRADLLGADLRGADIRSAGLPGADLRGSSLRGADLRKADLRGANLMGADLTGADLTGAALRRADLLGANLRRVNLWGANLRRANLTRTDLTGADLRETDLTGAFLTGAFLTGAYLWGANLKEVDLKVVDLTGACLTGADFRGAFPVDEFQQLGNDDES